MAHPRRRPRGGPHTGGLGSDPDMGAGQRFPSAGIARLPPSKTGASLFLHTNSDQIQLLCPGGTLQIEAKGHLNANIMAWYCKGVDMGVK